MPSSLMHLVATLGTAALLVGAEPAWPDLPDPIGLGPRLVTIEWLASHGRPITPGAPDAEIQAAYATANANAAPIVEGAEIDRLRYLLRVNHRINAPAEADWAVLARLLLDAEAAKRAAELADSRLASGRVTILPPTGPADADPSAPVPLRQQIRFSDLAWKVVLRSSGIPTWRQGGDGREFPREIGGIQARRVGWNGKDYRITAYMQDAPEPKARFTIATDIGSFQATQLTENAWEVVYTDNAGTPLTFRTGSSETVELDPADGRRITWHRGGETAP